MKYYIDIGADIHHNNNLNRLLDFDVAEHPLALQLGGDDPQLLAEAARILIFEVILFCCKSFPHKRD